MTNAALKSKPRIFPTDSGVSLMDRSALAEHLSGALADTYLLYLKTQSVHWNVVGPMFYGLHKLTEEQYEDMALAIDEIAERIRALGFIAPGSFKQFMQLSSIVEEDGSPTAEVMINQLIEGNELCSRKLRASVAAANAVEDVKTADLLTDRIGKHENNVWMLRALLA